MIQSNAHTHDITIHLFMTKDLNEKKRNRKPEYCSAVWYKEKESELEETNSSWTIQTSDHKKQHISKRRINQTFLKQNTTKDSLTKKAQNEHTTAEIKLTFISHSTVCQALSSRNQSNKGI